MVNVLVSLPLGEDFEARLRAADPRVNVRIAPAELRGWLRGAAQDGVDAAALEAQIVEFLQPAEVIVGFANLRAECRARAENLRWCQGLAAGIDRVDPAVYEQVLLTNASGVAAVPIAEYVIGMMLTFAKGFHHMLRRQQERNWDRGYQARELSGGVCGIAGMGAIGAETALRARALGLKVIATRRSVTAPASDEYADELLPTSHLPYLLGQSDWVVLAAPLTPETRHMIGAKELAMMKPSAVLINVGRGALVDEPALIQALQDGSIAGAGLDVFEQEPLPAESPLWEMPNVIVTPHFSSGSHRYMERAADLCADNLRRFLAGEQLRNIVDLARGY